ncbi:RraA family protein [Natrononativus amylolyticus]|uniref:RraA family protein n=1 Tax=Natrononativus amylolyticus TaxID=2963434 RepID=UPI0020CEEE82|nr:RraA family protein [Natrononativus amylolyticus]
MSIEDTELCDRYAGLYTGAVTDSLDELGYENQTLPSEINPIDDEFVTAGFAYPVRGRPDDDADYDENIRRFLEMLSDAPENSVIAYETHDDDAAHIGELSTTALQERGCRGAIVDGGARDLGYILEQGFPVFSRYRTPADAPPRWRLDEWNVSIEVGDIQITPGDVLVGDIDGVVCVPADRRVEVLERAEALVETEDDVRAAVREGVDPVTAYERYGTF